jgi:hypothetical protein
MRLSPNRSVEPNLLAFMPINLKKELPPVDDPEIARQTGHRLVELLFRNSEFALFPFMALGLGFWWILTLSHPYFWPTA